MDYFQRVSLLLLGLIFATSGCQSTAPSTLQASTKQESLENTWRIKAEIRQLVNESAIARDNLDAQAYANSFSKNGVFVTPRKVVTGRDAIRARTEAGPRNVAHMHLITTSQVTIVDAKNATGIVYTTVYAAPRDKSHVPGKPTQVKGPAALGKFHDEYQLTDEGWKISKRRYEWVFSPPASP